MYQDGGTSLNDGGRSGAVQRTRPLLCFAAMDGDPPKRHATYEDVLSAPPHKIAELIAGELILSPRPAPAYSLAAAALGEELAPPFKHGRGGPGGWIMLHLPEIHLGLDVLVPDRAGWRHSTMSHVKNEPFLTIRPDWVREVLSPSTERLDRGDKIAIYARSGVRHAWLVNPLLRTLEVLRLSEDNPRQWLTTGVFRDDAKVRAEPFDGFELDLAVLWEGVRL
jgi:Uma2 family endonuclease